MGAKNSYIAGQLIALLQRHFDDATDYGMVLAPDGILRLMPGLVRIPDVSFTRWDRLPGGVVPDDPIPDLAPDLAVEVLSEGNTDEEMERKIKEYFLSGVALVWLIDPETHAVRVYDSPESAATRHETDALDCPSLIPGPRVPVGRLFAKMAGGVKKLPVRRKGRRP